MQRRLPAGIFDAERSLGASTKSFIRRHYDVGPALAFIVMVAVFLRCAGALWSTGLIDPEGAEYARIAENLLAGVDYSGIATEGKQLFFPPLYPFLIAALSLIVGSAEIAALLISIVSGSLIVLPVFLIAKRYYAERTAVLPALLVGVHPFLIELATIASCESLFLVLALMAMHSSMQASDKPDAGRLAAAGAWYGLAYLVRPEALVYMVVALVFIAFARALQNSSFGHALFARLLLLPLVFLIVAGAYIGWLSAQTGTLRFETKSTLNLATAMRVNQGMTIDEAAFGVDPDLTPRGTYNQPNLALFETIPLDWTAKLRTVAKRAKNVANDAARFVAGSLPFGNPALFTLAVLGLFSRPWRRHAALDNLHMIVLLFLVIIGTLFIYYSHPRFYVLFIPVFCIWGIGGLVLFARFCDASLRLNGAGRALAHRAAIAASVGMLAAVVVPAGIFTFSHMSWARDERPIKEAFAELADSGPLHIASTSTPGAFHAKAAFTWLPYTDEATALRYLRRRGVTHVAIKDLDLASRPYLAKWRRDGVPSSQVVVEAKMGSGNAVVIYRFAP